MTRHEPLDPLTVHQPYKFTQQDYMLLAEHGTFDKLAKTELIEGVIVSVNAQYSRHARIQTLLFRSLARTCDDLSGALSPWLEASVSIDDRSMPQPDIIVSRGLPEDGPVTTDLIALVVEIADTSLNSDLGDKARLYASAGIREYWVADAGARVIHQMWAPVDDAYTQSRDIAFGERLTAATIPTLSVDTSAL